MDRFAFRPLYPNAPLKSDRAVQMIMAGNIGLHSETVAACIAFFWRHGDKAFVAEIYGLPPLGVVAELKRPLIEARAMLDQALGQEVA